ncbi:MAG: hypothetical protein CMJ49_09630 [Planctomycetaceae bacterium]|nr:hypothetical protein [Planctomycetaceae bacterium]
MPLLHPFHAIRYATPDGDLSARIAPPYDVLDEGPKRDLLAQDPYNIVEIDLPVTPPKTVGPDEAYRRAGQTMQNWIQQGVLQRDPEPALYGYEQQFTHAGKAFKRRGVFATMDIEDFGRHPGGIHRHELTIEGGLNDRYKLMAAARAQLSPIFCVFRDPGNTVAACLDPVFDQRDPDFHGRTRDKVRHLCWRITDPSIAHQLRDFFAPTDVFIADGHHRYITARNFARDHADLPDARRVLVMLVAAENPGMVVLSTHRILEGLGDQPLTQLLATAADDPRITITPTDHTTALRDLAAALPTAGPHAMGLFEGHSQKTALLTTTADPLESTLPDKPPVWRQLDVAILQHLVIDGLIQPHRANPITQQYTASLDHLPAMTTAAPGQLAVIMQPTPLDSVCAVSLAGQVMPAKSTFFYPKLATGLVIHPLTA